MRKVDGSVGEEDGFNLGRDGVDAVPGVCLGCPLCQRGVLPLISCLVPLAFLPILRQTLIEHVGESLRLVFDSGLGRGIIRDLSWAKAWARCVLPS